MASTQSIIIASVIPSSLLLVALALAAMCLRRRIKRRRGDIHRNITPIDDEEIESWKVDKSKCLEGDEPSSASPVSHCSKAHRSTTSVSSVRKPPSLIIYHARSSDDHHHQPQLSSWSSPPTCADVITPVLARAPNSRPGLTDESVKGDEAFITGPPPRRYPSRLAKLPRHARTRSAKSCYVDPWWPRSPDIISPRPSLDTLSQYRSGRRATVSTPSSFHQASCDEEFVLAGLSPRPLIHRSEIGRAIG